MASDDTQFIDYMIDCMNIDEDAKFDFEALLRIHFRLGRDHISPPDLIGLKSDALMNYLEVAMELSRSVDDFSEASRENLFKTALLMGIGLGVQLEKERRG